MWGEMSFRLVTFTDAHVPPPNLTSWVFLRIFPVVLLRRRLLLAALGQV
jgi:hypothetical protein